MIHLGIMAQAGMNIGLMKAGMTIAGVFHLIVTGITIEVGGK
jgi:hypothetical protein